MEYERQVLLEEKEWLNNDLNSFKVNNGKDSDEDSNSNFNWKLKHKKKW
jgi:hypothetical protein